MVRLHKELIWSYSLLLNRDLSHPLFLSHSLSLLPSYSRFPSLSQLYQSPLFSSSSISPLLRIPLWLSLPRFPLSCNFFSLLKLLPYCAEKPMAEMNVSLPGHLSSLLQFVHVASQTHFWCLFSWDLLRRPVSMCVYKSPLSLLRCIPLFLPASLLLFKISATYFSRQSHFKAPHTLNLCRRSLFFFRVR